MNETDDKKVHRAIFWTPDPTVTGKRAQVYTMNAEEAGKLLQAEYGSENTYSIRDDEESSRAR